MYTYIILMITTAEIGIRNIYYMCRTYVIMSSCFLTFILGSAVNF